MNKKPGYTERILRYAGAWFSHVVNGSPVCSKRQVLARLEICKSCPDSMYDTELEVCNDCGCFVNSMTDEEGPNKAAWADQQCPRGHWPRLDEGPKEGFSL